MHIQVHSDNRQGRISAARELIEKQCRSILFLRDQKKASTIQAEKKRYLEALEEGDSVSGILGNQDEKRLCQCNIQTVINPLGRKGRFDGVFGD